MKIIITEIGKITPQLTKHYVYNIVEGEEIILANQSLEAKPSEITALLKLKLEAFITEYEIDIVEVGTEIS